MLGKVEALCIGEHKGTRKSVTPSVRFVVDHGIDGDAHAGAWHRQVSLLAAEVIEKTRMNGLPNLRWGDFAENVVVSGLDLEKLGPGSRIVVGPGVVLELTQIGKECHTGCSIRRATGDCLMPRLGLFARVVAGGEVHAGDQVQVQRAILRTS